MLLHRFWTDFCLNLGVPATRKSLKIESSSILERKSTISSKSSSRLHGSMIFKVLGDLQKDAFLLKRVSRARLKTQFILECISFRFCIYLELILALFGHAFSFLGSSGSCFGSPKSHQKSQIIRKAPRNHKKSLKIFKKLTLGYILCSFFLLLGYLGASRVDFGALRRSF